MLGNVGHCAETKRGHYACQCLSVSLLKCRERNALHGRDIEALELTDGLAKFRTHPERLILPRCDNDAIHITHYSRAKSFLGKPVISIRSFREEYAVLCFAVLGILLCNAFGQIGINASSSKLSDFLRACLTFSCGASTGCLG
ncbi:hypothetical protein [Brucella sp. B13-0095]|uniref:hypothetical protein n=1 Tax=Brucella sp. B13-0095 TaxID=1867845 RepID=UPI00159F03C8|nr:hypothetical protein [Brucella sp. B13-0095]